ncbi:MAG: hypothetical protein M3P01_05425 [Actinomycetota bacterium]|nr:hypothetical protein [Actinomycetota bacterium]
MGRRLNDRGQVGILVVFTMIVVAAAVAWAVAAMATSNRSTAGPSTGPAPAASPSSDALNPDNAAAFNGPKHEVYDAAVRAPLSGTVHDITLEIEEKTLEVADGKFMHCGRHPFHSRQQGNDAALDRL